MLHEQMLGQRPASSRFGQVPRRSSRVACDEAAGLPGVEPQKLAKLLTGDLDKIVVKALQPEPSDRYATVDAFAADIERHRQLRPILARPDSTWYRASRFAARHRLGVARAEGARAAATKRFLVGLFDNSAAGSRRHAGL